MFIAKEAKTPEDMAKVRFIRSEVFIKEQNCPVEDEFDNYDNTSVHFLIFYDGKPVGCARLLIADNEKDIYKIGRIAVLKKYRKKGVGKEMCLYIIDKIKKSDGKKIHLDAQVQAKGFYETMGFTSQGDILDEVGIPHITMVKYL
jgi:predicted GNAT family N-acyltransferase